MSDTETCIHLVHLASESSREIFLREQGLGSRSGQTFLIYNDDEVIGTIVDQNGRLLLDITVPTTYSDIRKALLLFEEKVYTVAPESV